MVTLPAARDWLRLDGDENDELILGLVLAAVDYIETATGATPKQQETAGIVSLAETVQKMLLTLWYKPEQAEAERVQRTIDSLLKVITVKVASLNG